MLFHRGDTTNDGKSDITDAIALLDFLFLGGPIFSCLESGDIDNSGVLDITDGVSFLNYLFLGGPGPAAPGPVSTSCGLDTDPAGSPGDLGCNRYDHCQ